jgi:hypothetical protein
VQHSESQPQRRKQRRLQPRWSDAERGLVSEVSGSYTTSACNGNGLRDANRPYHIQQNRTNLGSRVLRNGDAWSCCADASNGHVVLCSTGLTLSRSRAYQVKQCTVATCPRCAMAVLLDDSLKLSPGLGIFELELVDGGCLANESLGSLRARTAERHVSGRAHGASPR